MKRAIMILGVIATLSLILSPFAFGQEEEVPGTVVLVNEPAGSFTVKDYDGQEYRIDYGLIVGQDIRTGDTVVVTVKDAEPVKVEKKD